MPATRPPVWVPPQAAACARRGRWSRASLAASLPGNWAATISWGCSSSSECCPETAPERMAVNGVPFARCARLTPSPVFVGIAAAPDALSLVYMRINSTRSTICRYVTAIYCTIVLVDTLVLGVRDQRQVECCGDSHQFGEGIDSHLPHNPAPVGLHRDLADTELGCDLFVQQAGDDQCHGLSFARRE